MNKHILSLVALAALCVGLGQTTSLRQLISMPSALAQAAPATSDNALAAAYRDQRSGIQVTGEGTVARLLSDDTEGSRHQRFILRLASGQTLLIAHNIDLAPRIESLRAGDFVAFNGVYEWNEKGGVIHWTHRDPRHRHRAGWLWHAGLLYQ